ncbi:hypothetical protein DEU56DRAFT_753152 [Suillus clintonianus]|uniref:uncharacterized protein n=1 Tax=Suillus clintonianus TaxID=1904413 RepID=UPI001B876E41|nr:uncharacterized protein DEU56DRAFT_753152 [Suillus clintonianus]KAG2148925.1 hypothetical protein DEU56DRAFT_753152 [Suillus clintonianus]
MAYLPPTYSHLHQRLNLFPVHGVVRSLLKVRSELAENNFTLLLASSGLSYLSHTGGPHDVKVITTWQGEDILKTSCSRNTSAQLVPDNHLVLAGPPYHDDAWPPAAPRKTHANSRQHKPPVMHHVRAPGNDNNIQLSAWRQYLPIACKHVVLSLGTHVNKLVSHPRNVFLIVGLFRETPDGSQPPNHGTTLNPRSDRRSDIKAGNERTIKHIPYLNADHHYMS